MIKIEGYLTQPKLETALKEIVGEDNWLGKELKVPGTRRRWDMGFTYNDTTFIVEFDGDQHYWDALKIKVDCEKDAIAISLGYIVVRIPYWVQLTTETLYYYFGIVADIEQSFPHGFITTKIFPASFCELGLARFITEMSALPTSVHNDIMKSLKQRCDEHGQLYILPKDFYTL